MQTTTSQAVSSDTESPAREKSSSQLRSPSWVVVGLSVGRSLCFAPWE